MIKKIIMTVILCFAVFAIAPNITFASDLTVSSAKSQGLVGEKPDGLLGAITSSANVESFVASTNAARIEQYKAVAKTNNISLAQVQQLAGAKLIASASAGQYIFKGGAWVKK